MPRYPHQVKTERPGQTAGTQNVDTGRMTAEPIPEAIWDGWGDVQQGDRRKPRDSSGEQAKRADATLYLSDPQAAALHQADDTAIITFVPGRFWPTGRVRHARVDGIDEQAGVLYLVYLGAAVEG